MKLISFIVLFCSLHAEASDVLLFCNPGDTPDTCKVQTERALHDQNCILETNKTNCHYSLILDPSNKQDIETRIPSDTPYCELTSKNCSSPQPGNFGGENCFGLEKRQIRRAYKVHNGYWFGPFGDYSRTLCRAR
ncbi:MAG: hypothetical protein EOP04_16995 [Proteobacteria bacterium]|nr:MAG: hypothetical protein EOP04_16995 [Pseudomonadota bacterium]